MLVHKGNVQALLTDRSRFFEVSEFLTGDLDAVRGRLVCSLERGLRSLFSRCKKERRCCCCCCCCCTRAESLLLLSARAAWCARKASCDTSMLHCVLSRSEISARPISSDFAMYLTTFCAWSYACLCVFVCVFVCMCVCVRARV